jgi:hypothetical protein
MANAWVEHIRKYAKDNNMTYACALTDPNCKGSYKKAPKPLTQKKERELMGAEEATTKAIIKKKKDHKEKVVALKSKMLKTQAIKGVPDKANEILETAKMGAEDKPAEENIKMTISEKKPKGRPRAYTLPTEETLERERAGMSAEDKKAPAKKRGRPAKYATAEEAKKAKTAKTIESNKRKAEEKKKAKEAKVEGTGAKPKMTGGADAVQKGLSAEIRSWIKKLVEDGHIGVKSRTSKNLYRSLCDIVHSNDIPAPKGNYHIDYTNSYDPSVQPYIDEANQILIAHGIKPPPPPPPPMVFHMPPPMPPPTGGKGLNSGKMLAEDMGGLTHIYPLHHNIILNMLRD